MACTVDVEPIGSVNGRVIQIKRPFCVIGTSFLLGALLASFLPFGVQVMLLVTGCIAFLLCLFMVKHPDQSTLACVFLLSASAIGIFCLRTWEMERTVEPLVDQQIMITAQITDIQPRSNHRYTYFLNVQADGDQIKKPFRTILYADASLNADYYDIITMPVLFYRPQSSQSFDSMRYYQSRGVFILGYADATVSAKVQQPETKPLFYYMKTLNVRLAQRIDLHMPAEQGGVLKSLILGDQSDIDFTLRERYTDAGIVHLFSISGLHVSILAGFLALLIRVIRCNRRLGVVVQLFILCGFIMLTGMQLSALRAGVMLLMVLVAQLFDRRSESINSLCFAGFMIVLWDIYAIMDIGFLMSLGATLGILLCNQPIYHWICKKFGVYRKWSDHIARGIAVSLAANLFLLPIYVLNYKALSTVFMPANLVVNLIGMFSIVIGFILVVLLWVAAPTFLLFPFVWVETQLITWQNHVARFFGSLPFATLGLDDQILMVCFGICALVMLAAWWFHRRQNVIKPALVLCVVVLLAGNVFSMLSLHGVVRIALIGDSNTSNLVIISNYNAVVVSPKDNAYIDERTYRYLKSKGVRQIDCLVLLYEDFALYQDTRRLVENFPVSNILYNRANIMCASILDGYADALLPIGEQAVLRVNDSMEMQFSYYYNLIDVLIDCRGVTLNLTSYVPNLQQIPSDIALLRGSVKQQLLELDTRHLILLERQWNNIIADMPYDNAAQHPIEFVVTQDGVLLRQQ